MPYQSDELLTIERVAVLQARRPAQRRARVTRSSPLRACSRRFASIPAPPFSSAVPSRTGCSSSPTARFGSTSATRTLVESGPGGVVGELAVLAPAPRSASVTAIEPTLLLRLRRGPFEELLDDRPEIARVVISTLATQLQAVADAGAGDEADVTSRARRRSRRIALLAGQAFALGLTTAWIAIPASAIFLESYGSGLLPVTYIGAAVAGAAASASLGVGLRRRPLASVAMAILAALAVVLCRLVARCCGRRARTGCRSGCSCSYRSSCRSASSSSWARPACSSMSAPQGALRAGHRRLRARVRRGRPRRPAAARRTRTHRGSARRRRRCRRDVPGLWCRRRDGVSRRSSRSSKHAGPQVERADAAIPAAPPLRRAHRRLSDVVRGGEPVARLPRVRSRRHSATPTRAELARFISRFSAIAYGTDIIFLLIVAGAAAAPLRAALRAHGEPDRGPAARRRDDRRHHRARVRRDDRLRAGRGDAGDRPGAERRHVADVAERRIPGGADSRSDSRRRPRSRDSPFPSRSASAGSCCSSSARPWAPTDWPCSS